MVNLGFTDGGVTSPDGQAAAERRVILSYVPAEVRQGAAAILALDDVMADILRTTSESMIGQMRLTWWHDALSTLGDGPAPHHPVLQGLAAHVVTRVPGGALARIVEGWEELLDRDTLSDEALTLYAEARGGGVFGAIAALVHSNGDTPVDTAGQGWALSDLAQHSTDPALRARAASLAAPLLTDAARTRWPRQVRALGAMVHLARRPHGGAGSRIGRALYHRLTGM